MNFELESTLIFVKVVQQGSFSRAAELLRIPLSTASRSISRLESELGTKLLLRTTRSLTLTPTGKEYFERSVGPITELEGARKSLAGKDGILSGRIKITANEDQGALVITPIISKIIETHPQISFELHYTSQALDLVKGGYDLALRVGRLNASRFKAKSLGEISIIAVASKLYLNGRNPIIEPSDLVDHATLVYGPGPETTRYVFQSKKGKKTISIKPHSVANHMPSLVILAMSNAGVAFVPEFICKEQLKSGSLVRVLPEWTTSKYALHLVFPNTSKILPRVKLVADEITKSVRELIL
ncbi:LysR family transcriptional regulator [bacterium]|nr:LysR family transcriptional regulator [bacterium]